MKQLIAAVLFGGMTLGLGQAALAAPEKGVSVMLGGGRYFYDSDRGFDDTNVVEGGLGVILNKRLMLEAVYSDLASEDTDVPGLEVDGKMYRLDALYHLTDGDSWQPYFAIGLGVLEKSSALGDDNDTMMNVGGGIKKYFGDRLSVRADARSFLGLHNDDNELDGMVTVGLSYVFGAQSSAPAAKPEVRADSDGDGVSDAVDRCPNTPAGVAVDATGCPLDSDGDGVANYKDDCANTPRGARVDDKGCQYVIKKTVQVELEVLFDLNATTVNPAFFGEIKRVAEFMKLFPSVSGVVEGHTDATGEADYNQQLSQQRAEAVRAVLVNQHGIAADRLTAKGFGEARPRASNDSRDGRKQNRRVVAVLKTETAQATD